MTIRVENIMAMENVGGGDKALKEVFKANRFAFWKVSGRHGVDEGPREA